MGSLEDVPGASLLRTLEHEHEDFEVAVERAAKAAYDEWPNQAGFDALDEHRGPVPIPLKGTIPPWAAGSLFRNGPGGFKISDTPKGDFVVKHWFDGFAHAHRFDIAAAEDGSMQVSYSSRRQSDAWIAQIKKNGGPKLYTFAQSRDPCIGMFGKFMAAFRSAFMLSASDQAAENICVAVAVNVPGLDSARGNLAGEGGTPAGQRMVAGHRAGVENIWLTTDTARMREIDPVTLEPTSFVLQKSFSPSLSGPTAASHVQRDPVTGDFFNFNKDPGAFGCTYRVFRVSAATGETTVLATIRRPDVKAAYIHSFFLSPSFVILCVPGTHLAWGAAKILWEGNIVDAMEPWDPNRPAKWLVIDRHHGKGVVADFDSPALCFFHTINAFEEKSRDGAVDLYCDLIEYPTNEVIRCMYYDILLNEKDAAKDFWGDKARARRTLPSLVRYRMVVPLASDATSPEVTTATQAPGRSGSSVEKLFTILSPHAGELPTIHPAYATRRQRYVYCVSNRGFSTLFDSMIKIDMDTREVLFWTPPQGHSPGEAVFVPNPAARSEDDGVLLSVVLDGINEKSYLLCLNAENMQELGRAEMEFAVGVGFHGAHVSSPARPNLG